MRPDEFRCETKTVMWLERRGFRMITTLMRVHQYRSWC